MNDYKTTVAGVVLGGITAIEPIITNGDFNPKRDWVKIVVSVGIFLLGVFAKDRKAVQ